ncbi:glycosyltransferase family 2 protein [Shewanella sp. 125m-1]
MPTISVIIPTHNRCDLLKNAIDSVLKQTISVEEVIVVDDTQNAESEVLVESYNNSKIKLFRNNACGAHSSRNLGAAKASSEYIAFLDDDDIWLDDKIEMQKPFLVSNDAVFSQIQVNYTDLNIKYNTRAKNNVDSLNSILTENFIGGTISSIINRDLFLDLGGFDTNFPAREEYDLWIRIISKGSNIHIVEKALSVGYRSFSRDRISASISNYEKAIQLINKKHSVFASTVLSDKELDVRTSKQYKFLAAQAVSINKRLTSSKYYLKSFIIERSLMTLALALIAFLSPVLLIKLRSKL